MRDTDHLHAVVIAGGAGERLWPRSHPGRPKPLLAPGGGATLLERTLQRARSYTAPERIWLVCTRENAAALRRVAALPRGHVWVEPRGRDTAMAVGWAALRLVARDPEAVMAVLPADHLVPDRRAFGRALRGAAAAARGGDALVTLGIRPTRPETGYGYIRAGAAQGPDYPGLHGVRRFVEKPPLPQARRFLRSGDYLWNAGIFVWRARTILEEIERHAPAVHRALAPLRHPPRRTHSRPLLDAAYGRAPSRSIDRAVLEKSRRIWVYPVDFAWSDVGNWAALAAALGVAGERSLALGGEVLLCDTRGSLAWGGKGRPLLLLGVEDLAVIDSDDALLVAKLDRCPDLKPALTQLRKRLTESR